MTLPVKPSRRSALLQRRSAEVDIGTTILIAGEVAGLPIEKGRPLEEDSLAPFLRTSRLNPSCRGSPRQTYTPIEMRRQGGDSCHGQRLSSSQHAKQPELLPHRSAALHRVGTPILCSASHS